MPDLAQDLEIWSGCDWSIDLDITDEDGAALALTGTTVIWRLADIYDVTNIFIEKSSASPTEIVLHDPGGVTVIITPDDTKNLGGQPYYHEAVIVDAAGTTVPIMSGTAIVHKSAANVL